MIDNFIHIWTVEHSIGLFFTMPNYLNLNIKTNHQTRRMAQKEIVRVLATEKCAEDERRTGGLRNSLSGSSLLTLYRQQSVSALNSSMISSSLSGQNEEAGISIYLSIQIWFGIQSTVGPLYKNLEGTEKCCFYNASVL